ncbi:MAG: HEAT repeat domain-containing protein, partial [Planctomycetota bacterium]
EREAIRTGRDKSLKGARPEPYLASLKERLDLEIKVLAAVEEGFAKLTDADAILYLAKTALPKQKHWKAREIAARTLGEVGDRKLIPFLVKGLKDKDPRVRATVLLSLGGMRAEEAFEDVLKMLGDKDWIVRSAAIDTLAKIRDMKAIEPLIERLKKEEGRLAEDVAEALTDLTGQKFGTIYDAWKRWWADHGEKLLAGDAPQKAEEEEEKRPDDEYYHGIPVKSHRTIFILDISDSMTYSTTEFTEKPKPGEKNRLDLAKEELGRAIDHYPPSGTFGLIAFHTVVKGWRPRLVKAAEGMKKDAKVWVEDLKPTGTTNIYGALELAFRMAGMGIQDKYYPPTADTIFLLSDGAPTNEDLTDDSPDRVLRAVRQWNSLKRMKIHTIGLKGHSAKFMRALAKENGGTYTSREK